MAYKILLVDDDEDDREFFLTAVSKVSYEVSCAVLESCINLIADLSLGTLDRPDLIFLDINMPEMSGWECLAALKDKQQLSDIPVIMYSTSQHIEEAVRAKSAGALSFFSKPYDIKELKETIKIVIDHLDRDALSDLNSNSDRFY